MIDAKSQAWRDAADKLLERLAESNQYLVSDILIIFLESAGYGLKDYGAIGGVFKRGAKKGVISQIERNSSTKTLWKSNIYRCKNLEME